MLNDFYTNEDINNIARICTKKLFAKRKGLVIDVESFTDDTAEISAKTSVSIDLSTDISSAKKSIH
jgi:hypothetical protein